MDFKVHWRWEFVQILFVRDCDSHLHNNILRIDDGMPGSERVEDEPEPADGNSQNHMIVIYNLIICINNEYVIARVIPGAGQ